MLACQASYDKKTLARQVIPLALCYRTALSSCPDTCTVGDFLTFYFAVENKCIFKYIQGNTSSVKAISPTLYIYNPYAEVTELFSHHLSKFVNCKWISFSLISIFCSLHHLMADHALGHWSPKRLFWNSPLQVK